MPTGRPLGIATIKQHLNAVASDLPAGTDREMITTIATHLGQKNFMRPDTLHDVVKDLDAFVGRQREFLGGDTVAYTNRCIDALARMEAKFADVMRKPTKKAPTKKMMGTYAPKETKPVVAARVSITSTEAIIGAIGVLLEEVADNSWNDNTFDTLRHLIDVLDNLVS